MKRFVQHIHWSAKYLAILTAFCLLTSFLAACKERIAVEEQFPVDQTAQGDLLAEWKEGKPKAIIVDTVQTDINQDGKLDLIVAYCIAENQMDNVLNQLSVWVDGYSCVGFAFDTGEEQYLMGSLEWNENGNIQYDSYAPKVQAIIAREVGVEVDPDFNSIGIIAISDKTYAIDSGGK